MAYSKQTFTIGQVLTAAHVNQIEDNVADHLHGSDGVGDSFTSISVTGSLTATGDVQVGSATGAEINFLSGVSSKIQYQLDGKHGLVRALATNSSSQGIGAGTIQVAFDTEVEDTDNFYNASSTQALFITDDSIQAVQLGCSIRFRVNTGSAGFNTQITKNGGTAYSIEVTSVGEHGNYAYAHKVTPYIPVNSGDYFQVNVFASRSSDCLVAGSGDDCNFWIAGTR